MYVDRLSILPSLNGTELVALTGAQLVGGFPSQGNNFVSTATIATYNAGANASGFGLGLTRAQIPTATITVSRFYTIDGAPWVHGSGAGPYAIQDASGQWWQLDLSGGVANALWFGASTSGTASANATAIQAALNTGVDVYIPGGTYAVTSLSMNSTGQNLFGDGCGASGGTVLTLSPGTGDGITVGSSSAYVTGMRISDIQLNLSAATGGNAINCTKVKDFIASNVIIVSPQKGILLTSANTVVFQDINILSVATGASNYGFKAVGTDADPINVLSLYRWTCSPVSSGASGRAMAMIFDGNVQTVDMLGVGSVHMGRGLWTVNTGGASTTVNFVQAHSFQSDFPELEGIRLEVGGQYFFQNYYVHGSQTLDGVYVGSAVNDVNFGLGYCTGHYHNGMSLNGVGAVVAGSIVSRNSVSGSNTYDGIAIAATADGVVIAGNQIGRANNLTALQRYAVSIASGAANVTIGVNDTRGNVTGTVLDSGSSSTSTDSNRTHVAGSAYTEFSNANGLQFTVGGSTATIVNNLRAFGGATGGGPGLIAEGGDTDIDVKLTPKGAGLVNIATGGVKVGANQVLSTRQTGFGVPTGAADQGNWAAGSITLANLAAEVAKIQNALIAHGLIGA